MALPNAKRIMERKVQLSKQHQVKVKLRIVTAAMYFQGNVSVLPANVCHGELACILHLTTDSLMFLVLACYSALHLIEFSILN